MKHILEADGILYDIGPRRILSDVYIKCETGKITALLGRNGQGKTCLLNTIYGLSGAQSKSIRIDKTFLKDPGSKPGLLTYLPQNSFLPGSLKIKEVFADFDVSISDFLNHFPEFESYATKRINNLSSGEIRLMETYLIIQSNSWFSMLDEPFLLLSPLNIEKLKQILKAASKTKGILITDHLYNDVLEIADFIYVLKNGKTFSVSSVEGIEEYGYLVKR